MSSIVSTIFGGGGDSGVNYRPTPVAVDKPITIDQANQQYANVQQGLTGQQALINALQGQNALQNQSTVYNQLQGVASGQGPNPAQAMLANTTGQNIANQAALMAGQRGAGQNIGLMARQAANQGANIQQNAAGQAAALQANQSLNALGQMGGLANQQAGQLLNAQNTYGNQALQAQQNALSGISGQNQAAISQQNAINAANAQRAAAESQMQGNMLGGLLQGAGAVAGTMLGGPVGGMAGSAIGGALGGSSMPSLQMPSNMLGAQGYAEGGEVEQSTPMPMQQPSGPQSNLGKFLSGGMRPMMANGGKVPALVSPGEVYLDPNDVQKVKAGASPLKVGEKIPGTPKHPGNDYRNDTVRKTLESGGIVVPNKVMQSDNKDEKARAFVAAVLAKKGRM